MPLFKPEKMVRVEIDFPRRHIYEVTKNIAQLGYFQPEDISGIDMRKDPLKDEDLIEIRAKIDTLKADLTASMTRLDIPIPVQAAENYEELLAKNFELKAGEMPRFDCMILGMGSDGHVASLFPDIVDYIDTHYQVIDVFEPKTRSSRITMTMPVINNSRACIFLISGREKHPALSRVLNLLTSPDMPAQHVRPNKGELIWILDQAAAQG